MKQLAYLLNFTVSGIKNIEKPVHLEFYKKGVDTGFDADQYRIKAIYGENGSGKTGIVTAVFILKNLLRDKNYLNDRDTQRKLQELINKKTQELCLACEVLITIGEFYRIYQYEVTLHRDEEGKYVIREERLQRKSGTYQTARYHEVYLCSEGVLQRTEFTNDTERAIRELSQNVLQTQTLIATYAKHQAQFKEDRPNMEGLIGMSSLILLGLTLFVRLEETDRHDQYFLHRDFRTLQKQDGDVSGIMDELLHSTDSFHEAWQGAVRKEHFPEYERRVARLERFLQIFKRDLKAVIIDKKENVDQYECSLVMDYGDYRIASEFESTGIKKLLQLFDYLDLAAEGCIVFIDEMDSNINDVYLCKLVDYFMQYEQGQLCFTTHNTSPMELLRKNKKSIDFLSDDNQLVPWRTNGNFAPEKLYQHGLIEHLPFNIEPEDFIGILGEE